MYVHRAFSRLAQCCLALDKLNEAEHALRAPHTEEKVIGGAAGLYLLGCICRKGNRRDSAISYFKQSLQLDASLWSSLVELGEMGVPVDTTSLFGLDMETSLSALRQTSLRMEVQTMKENTRDKENRLEGGVFKSVGVKSLSQQFCGAGANFTAMTIPESKKYISSLAEQGASIVGATQSHSNTALALGMSSLSLRMPFASPGSAPSPFGVEVNSDKAACSGYRGHPFAPRLSNGGNSVGAGVTRALFGTPGLTPIHTVGNINENKSKTGPSSAFSDGPTILSAVGGSAFRSTGVGLEGAASNDSRDGFIVGSVDGEGNRSGGRLSFSYEAGYQYFPYVYTTLIDKFTDSLISNTYTYIISLSHLFRCNILSICTVLHP